MRSSHWIVVIAFAWLVGPATHVSAQTGERAEPRAADAAASDVSAPGGVDGTQAAGGATGESPPAEPTEAEPTEAARAAAREAYARGGELFAEGRFDEAKAAFEAAYEAVPNPIVLLPIAESALKLGRVPEAIALLARYLAERPDAPDHAEIQQRLAVLQATPAVLAIESLTAGVTVKVDGERVPGDLPQVIELAPGPHTLEASADGRLTQQEDLIAEAGVRHEWTIQLDAAPPPAAAAVVAAPKVDAPAPEDSTAAIWVSGVVGATGLLAGSVLGFMALAENSDYDADPTIAGADRGERLALFADVAFGIGAMALITGAVLYLTNGESLDADSARHAPIQLGGGAGPGGAFLSTTVRY